MPKEERPICCFCAGSADEKIEALPSYLQKYLAKKTTGKATCFRCLAGMGDGNFRTGGKYQCAVDGYKCRKVTGNRKQKKLSLIPRGVNRGYAESKHGIPSFSPDRCLCKTCSVTLATELRKGIGAADAVINVPALISGSHSQPELESEDEHTCQSAEVIHN